MGEIFNQSKRLFIDVGYEKRGLCPVNALFTPIINISLDGLFGCKHGLAELRIWLSKFPNLVFSSMCLL